MAKTQKSILLAKNDYEVIMSYLRQSFARPKFGRQDIEDLTSEIKKATLLHTDDMPADVVRLNSTVTIQEETANKAIQLVVVTPEKADIKTRKVSIFSPIGTALIGFRKGEKISWKVPAGNKVFTILDVANNF
jgi:regulator of nucleoside diphosphate kinase